VRLAFVSALPAILLIACHGRRTSGESVSVASEVLAAFRDTSTTQFPPAGAREYDTRRPAQRDSLRAVLARQRAEWTAMRPSAYRMLVRASCFCPGQRGWVLVESRDGKPSRVWTRTGAVVPLSEWSVLDVDRLYDSMQHSVETNSWIVVAFDARWHFPSYVRSSMPPLPDTWSIIEARALGPR
jgi:hypothetical protein